MALTPEQRAAMKAEIEAHNAEIMPAIQTASQALYDAMDELVTLAESMMPDDGSKSEHVRRVLTQNLGSMRGTIKANVIDYLAQ